MIQATRNYVTLVNEVIDEAGTDLALFMPDGSDFTTNSDAMMNRFKTWVKRAWRDIQQESLDWEWMSQQAVVNIKPGIMFYSPHIIDWTPTDVNPLIIYDVDGTQEVVDIEATKLVNLTGIYTELENFGYIDVQYTDYTLTNQHALDFGMKAGGEYFVVQNPLTISFLGTTSNLTFEPSVGDSIGYYVVTFTGAPLGAQADDRSVVVSKDTVGDLFNVSLALYNPDLIQLFQAIASAQATSIAFDFTVECYDQEGGTLLATIDSNDGNILFSYASVTLPSFPGEVSFLGAGVADLNGGPVVGATITNIEIDGTDYENAGVITHTASGFVSFMMTNIDAYMALLPFFESAANWDVVLSTPAEEIVQITRSSGESDIISVFQHHNVPYFPFQNFIHSWKSYDWSEELDDDDFVENVREINQKTFRLISHEQPATARELPLDFMPWEYFQNKYDFASTLPSTPRYVTEDNTGRWRFYPPPDRPYTVLFDYVREPQILSAWDDVPKGLPEEYIDLIMWRALQYYGEFDEQPNSKNRGYVNYKTLLMKFEMQTREKFHFKPRRLW